jgi:capsular polysaccharide export protein
MHCFLLQGPVGPFFNTLYSTLASQGWDVTQICLNGADKVFSSKTHTTWTGDTRWILWFDELITLKKPDVVILFGAERPAHKKAIRIAKAHKIPVLCLEEGYIRPGYITAEWGGNNHISPLQNKNIRDYTSSPLFKTPYTDSTGMGPLLGWSALYYTARTLFSRPSQRRLYHKKFFGPAEVLRWSLNYIKKSVNEKKDAQTLISIKEKEYDVVTLQVPGDKSLVEGGDGWTTGRLIIDTLHSFKSHAPSTRHIIFKLHPLGRGHDKSEYQINDLALDLEIQDRVHIIYTGPLAPVLKNARGLIAITSTSSISSIEKGKITLVLGKGITRKPEIALCGPSVSKINSFWTSPFTPQQNHINTFMKMVKSEALLPGDYYTKKGRERAATEINIKLKKEIPLFLSEQKSKTHVE